MCPRMNGQGAEMENRQVRRLFMILSPRALPYAKKCVESLFAKASESLEMRFLTDSAADKQELIEVIGAMLNPHRHRWWVIDDAEATERASEKWASWPNLVTFRRGHPCWRKITDPLLFSRDNEEMTILDPDLYFPNRFNFEPTPETGVCLMWQRPNCMIPAETVRAALNASVALARHVDIGVAQWRAGQDLAWCDWLIGKLGGEALPRIMHVESIIWSAIAMRFGGGYLDPQKWLCWQRTQWKRVLLIAGVGGTRILRNEPFHQIKCFHAGGMAKWWLAEAEQAGILDQTNKLLDVSPIRPFVELTRQQFELEQSIKGLLRLAGYYRLMKNS